jgi:hypothetical protein
MNGNTEITAQLLTGDAIAEALDDLATLRLDIFPEYPYLQLRRFLVVMALVAFGRTPAEILMAPLAEAVCNTVILETGLDHLESRVFDAVTADALVILQTP